jgi:excinuclease ABC subunit A
MKRDQKPEIARSMNDCVRVRGARVHNLKDVNVDLPRDALVVFTGISGSGKSSLAFGTLYAEAQRRYFESVSPYARRLIDQVGVPDVDSIEGLPPAVALQQQRGSTSTRSSVGSVTALSNLLRMLYSRAGTYPASQPMLYAEDFSPNTPQGACPACHGIGRIYDATEQSMVPDTSLTIRERAVAAWPPAWHGQNLRDILVSLGYNVDKPWRELPKKVRDWILFTDEQPTVPVYAGFTPAETRAALRAKDEPSYLGTFTGARKYVLQTFANSPSALMRKRVSRYIVGRACPLCKGQRLKPQALKVTFGGRNISELSSLPVAMLAQVLAPAAQGRFEPEAQQAIFSHTRSRAERARRTQRGQASHRSAPDVRLTPNLSEEKRIAAQRIARDVVHHAEAIAAIGLGYLSLERSTPSLSPGELQRLRLVTQVRSNLFGVVYVLDEPTAGLHPADSLALMTALDQLKSTGNSLFVVEHDLAVMRRADWLVDVGPDAGESGGRILYSGPPDGLRDVPDSHTRRYLFAPDSVTLGTPRSLRKTEAWLTLNGIRCNNLDGLDARFPVGALTAVTGVSGSGKSSLVTVALAELVSRELGHEPIADDSVDALEPAMPGLIAGRIVGGLHGIQRLVIVDQKPIGRTPRSNLATYTGIFDVIRKLFANTSGARARHFDAGRFSFNVAKGRCSRCEGEGFVSVELLFMPSVFAPCPACHGARYNEATLAIRYRDKNVAEVLAMTVDAAAVFFEDEPLVLGPLTLMQNIGLGYLRLGQPATELSGGEAQRIKLASELQRRQRGHTLYVLDEPTTGLHPVDVDRLMTQIQDLVDSGHTVVLVEHETRVVAACDWMVDLGPGAGHEGGRIVTTGAPADVARARQGVTAQFLPTA